MILEGLPHFSIFRINAVHSFQNDQKFYRIYEDRRKAMKNDAKHNMKGLKITEKNTNTDDLQDSARNKRQAQNMAAEVKRENRDYASCKTLADQVWVILKRCRNVLGREGGSEILILQEIRR